MGTAKRFKDWKIRPEDLSVDKFLKWYFSVTPSPTDEEYKNAEKVWSLLSRILDFLEEKYEGEKFELVFTSGHRPPKYNTMIGGAKRSLHTKARALDFVVLQGGENISWDITLDLTEKLDKWDFYMENLKFKRPEINRWVHIDLGGRGIKRSTRFFCP